MTCNTRYVVVHHSPRKWPRVTTMLGQQPASGNWVADRIFAADLPPRLALALNDRPPTGRCVQLIPAWRQSHSQRLPKLRLRWTLPGNTQLGAYAYGLKRASAQPYARPVSDPTMVQFCVRNIGAWQAQKGREAQYITQVAAPCNQWNERWLRRDLTSLYLGQMDGSKVAGR